MKKIIVFLLSLTFIFSFSYSLETKKKERLLIGRPDPPEKIRKMQADTAQKKREMYFRSRERTQERISQYASRLERVKGDNPNAVNIKLDSSYTHWQEDPYGEIYMTGLCQNVGSKTAVSVSVEIKFYDVNQNYLGSGWSYVYGGSNVQVDDYGEVYCLNALGPGDSGFFNVWAYGISYSQAYYYSATFAPYYTGSYPPAGAKLTIDGEVRYTTDSYGDLKLYGYSKNSSSAYAACDVYVHLAVFNNDHTKILDVAYGYVNGSSFNYCYDAILPYQSQPFEAWLYFASSNENFGDHLTAFEWYETRVSSLEEKDPPFGTIETPVNEAKVCSSISVSGWVLDDSGVDSVKIYLETGKQLDHIGDATFVEGARPDVAEAYPQYPNNTRAGWGYMLLTNFLPNGGNGTFVLHAIATDAVGKTTTLGTKTIICDNANAVKPFGAIDTPGQGSTVSGSDYINWGWALTPQPNTIPTDGSTINVYVDGVNLGNPQYNIYRADIADLFPNYTNSSGAAGNFKLDTTAYENGVHTIQWTATDDAGNTDGIGSRYFTISNYYPGTQGKQSQTGDIQPGFIDIHHLSQLPEDNSTLIRVKQGFKADIPPQEVLRDENGMNRTVSKELERIEIHLSDQPSNNISYSGYMKVGHHLMALPVGSTLDAERGIFYWQPGPGFLGRYHLVFVETSANGTVMKKNIIVEIVPKPATEDAYGK